MYASQTTVSPERSRSEIEDTVKRYGAGAFAFASRQDRAVIQFELERRLIRFTLPLPDPADPAFRERKRRGMKPQRLTEAQAARIHQQEVRRRWRALSLIVKAKLEAVGSHVATLDEEFLANLVVPGGATVGDVLVPQVARMIESGKAPRLALPGVGETGA